MNNFHPKAVQFGVKIWREEIKIETDEIESIKKNNLLFQSKPSDLISNFGIIN